MAHGCRDCSTCTESILVSLVKLPFRVLRALLTFWNIGLITRYCPECGHRMNKHRKLRDGRFMD